MLYLDIDVHHGDGVEEAFYTTGVSECVCVDMGSCGVFVYLYLCVDTLRRHSVPQLSKTGSEPVWSAKRLCVCMFTGI